MADSAASARPEHSNTTVYGSATGAPIRDAGSSSRLDHPRRADLQRVLTPHRRRLRHRDVVDPLRVQHRGDEQTRPVRRR